MKLIKESINEKFSQGEDKLKTLGIGEWRQHLDLVLEKFNVKYIEYDKNGAFFYCDLLDRSGRIVHAICNINKNKLRLYDDDRYKKYTYDEPIKTLGNLINALDNFDDDWDDRSDSENEIFKW